MTEELYRWSVAIHVVSAIVWIGAMWFIGLVLAPELRRVQDPGLMTELFHRIGVRLRPIGWTCITLLILTGLYNLGHRGVNWARFWSPEFLGSRLGILLGIKLSAVLAIIALSALHDFAYGPKLRSLVPDCAEWAILRRKVAWIGRINAVLAAIVVILAVRLFR